MEEAPRRKMAVLAFLNLIPMIELWSEPEMFTQLSCLVIIAIGAMQVIRDFKPLSQFLVLIRNRMRRPAPVPNGRLSQKLLMKTTTSCIIPEHVPWNSPPGNGGSYTKEIKWISHKCGLISWTNCVSYSPKMPPCSKHSFKHFHSR